MLIASKWSMLILPALAHTHMRNSELMRMLGGASRNVPTQTLRDLERNGPGGTFPSWMRHGSDTMQL
jgi:DNA-binding HxlR family transcriptional regulator